MRAFSIVQLLFPSKMRERKMLGATERKKVSMPYTNMPFSSYLPTYIIHILLYGATQKRFSYATLSPSGSPNFFIMNFLFEGGLEGIFMRLKAILVEGLIFSMPWFLTYYAIHIYFMYTYTYIQSFLFCFLSRSIVTDLTVSGLGMVHVTIPNAIQSGRNAILTCDYELENEDLYSVKWYKGMRRRWFIYCANTYLLMS